TDHATYCPYKGDCAYYSIPLGGERAVNAVWSYEAPYAAVAAIKDYVAFYPTRVDAIEERAEERSTTADAAAAASQLLADHAIGRVGPAAADRDEEQHDADQQHVLVAALADRESLRQMRHHERNGHFDRQRRGEEAGEQADDEADRADGLEKHGRVGERDAGLEPLPRHVSRNAGRTGLGRDLHPAVHQQVVADDDAQQRVGDVDERVVESTQSRPDQPGFTPGSPVHGVLHP